MRDQLDCPECHTPLPLDSPHGLCSRCLMEAALLSSAPKVNVVPKPTQATKAAPKPLTLEAFRITVLELELVDPDSLDAHCALAGGDLDGLIQSLIEARKLTSYQASSLRQGKAKGLVIGPYLVLNKRGQGGMGIVFRARHRVSQCDVALKILRPSFSSHEEAVHRFRREFEVAARLQHPNVVAALEADEYKGVQYLTMRYVDGNDLDELVQAVGPIPIKLSLHCVIQAARGLAAAHSEGIIHRDVKPSNLMLDRTGTVRVLDLGLARVIEATNPLTKNADGTLTETGTYMGTVDFIAPEQANDPKRVDHRADIYGLGCTLYYLLTARPPFENDTILERLIAHQQQPAPSLRDIRDEISPALESAYQRMVAKSPDDRPGSMQDVIEMLEACRLSPQEAIEAQEGLKTFSDKRIKRAPARSRERGADASVFARRKTSDDLVFDSDLRIEDMVSDYREVNAPRSLTEEQLPPRSPRPVPVQRRKRRQSTGGVFKSTMFIALGMALTYLIFRTRPELPTAQNPQRIESTQIAPPGNSKSSPASLENRQPRPISIFNGRDLSGWSGDVDDYEVRDGLLACKPDKGATIFHHQVYQDYVAHVEFRISPKANSGLAIHYPGDGNPSEAGLCEIQILDDNHPEYANIDPRRNSGSAYGMVAARRDFMTPMGEWNTAQVTVRGSTIKVELNGETILAADLSLVHDFYNNLPHPGQNRTSGYFGLFGMPGGPVEFRKIEITNLKPSQDQSAPGPRSPAA